MSELEREIKREWTKRVMFKLVEGVWEMSIKVKDKEIPLTPRDRNVIIRTFQRGYGLDRRKRLLASRGLERTR